MSLGSRTRRIASGLVVGWLVALAGCRAMPVSQFVTNPNRPQSTLAAASRAALLPATVAMDPPSEMSSIEPVPTNASSITPAGDAGKPAPTPLLDAALIRAKGLDEPARSANDPVQPPTPEPPTQPPTPAPAPTPTPALISKVEFPVMPTPSPVTPQEPTAEAEPSRPEEAWRDGVRRLASLARARLELGPAGGSGSPSWALRARILSWLAEPDLDPELGHREANGVRAVLRALDDTPTESPRRGEDVRSAVVALEDRAPLEITELRFCSNVDGFGTFDAVEPPVHKAGEPILLYCELDGLRFEQTAAGFRTKVAAQLEILPHGGGPAIHTRPLEVAEETCRRRRRDYYIVYKLLLPRTLTPGDYRLRLTSKDLNSDRSTTHDVAFAIARD
jgi:hypothetical protein